VGYQTALCVHCVGYGDDHDDNECVCVYVCVCE
jgi:hypothetical protein